MCRLKIGGKTAIDVALECGYCKIADELQCIRDQMEQRAQRTAEEIELAWKKDEDAKIKRAAKRRARRKRQKQQRSASKVVTLSHPENNGETSVSPEDVASSAGAGSAAASSRALRLGARAPNRSIHVEASGDDDVLEKPIDALTSAFFALHPEAETLDLSILHYLCYGLENLSVGQLDVLREMHDDALMNIRATETAMVRRREHALAEEEERINNLKNEWKTKSTRARKGHNRINWG